MKKYIIHIVFGLVCISGIAVSQTVTPNVVASQGDFFTSTPGSVSWTLGEISVETYSISSNYVTQGFQQPRWANIMGIASYNDDNSLSVYPNPVSEQLYIQFKTRVFENGTVEVYNMQGQKLSSEKLPGTMDNKYSIPFTAYNSGIYLLNISNEAGNKKVSYRICKAN
jgi:hypothetical protein